MFSRVLIANRGEIALRVARTCRELGVESVAAYAVPDRDSAVVRFADDAVCVGPAPARHSYLNMPALVEAALRTGAEAVHPGYGFLSENPDFAEVCRKNGLVLIGPPPPVMERLGDKAAARELMAAAGLPVPPGSGGPVGDEARAAEVAGETGFPLVVKAAAGGGGRGIRLVREPAALASAFHETRAEAGRLFGDDTVYIERFVEPARHIEVQILADRHGNAVHLGARDCSVQRRRQKLIEEAPPASLPAGTVREMGEAAVRGALAVGYEGAGTFEFVVDDQDRYFFIEVNCRIQVEHPVTEMITGVDLVEQQLRIAAGERLVPGAGARGVALECRVNTEDPGRDFAPTPGEITLFEPPGGPFTRVDTQGFTGCRVPAAYDPLLAKVVVWAPDRPRALARMRRALAEFRVGGPGVRTTLPFLAQVLDDPRFRAARHRTSLVDTLLAPAPGERTRS
ncbi:acetyl-CoA carboxylase biotin carboxylase subunit [Streptomyces niveiscabiei]|uniref:biotin carboxylase n=1 Tax=Streptomyces niveiscabiei TaxID=164115 RepID=A0ABW9HHK8_9ACTN